MLRLLISISKLDVWFKIKIQRFANLQFHCILSRVNFQFQLVKDAESVIQKISTEQVRKNVFIHVCEFRKFEMKCQVFHALLFEISMSTGQSFFLRMPNKRLNKTWGAMTRKRSKTFFLKLFTWERRNFLDDWFWSLTKTWQFWIFSPRVESRGAYCSMDQLVSGKILAGPKISAGLKNYENLKIGNFRCFFSSAVQNLAWFLVKTGFWPAEPVFFPKPEFFRRLVNTFSL
jgi:hypothetical protein